MSGRLRRHLTAQAVSTVVVAGLGLGLQIVLARLLGPDRFGFYGIVATAGAILMVVQDGGFRMLLYREATRATAGLPPPGRLLQEATGWTGLVTALACAGAAIAGPATGAAMAGALALTVLTNAGRALAAFGSSLLRAADRFGDEARWQMLHRAATTLAMAGTAVLVPEVLPVLAAGLLAQVAVFAALRMPVAWGRPARPRLGPVATACGLFVAVDVLTALYLRVDVLLLAAFGRPAAEIGAYAALTRIVDAYVLGVTPVAMLFFRSARLDGAGAGASLRRVALVSGLFLLPALAAIGIALRWGRDVLVLVLGPGYGDAAPALPWITGALVLLVPNFLMGQLLLARHAERAYLAAAGFALATNLALNAVLIPLSGATGAAQATVATEAALCLALGLACAGMRSRERRLAGGSASPGKGSAA